MVQSRLALRGRPLLVEFKTDKKGRFLFDSNGYPIPVNPIPEAAEVVEGEVVEGEEVVDPEVIDP